MLILFLKKIGRTNIFINTGVHGNNEGRPTKGEVGFLVADMTTIGNIEGVNVCPNNMTPWSNPIYPDDRFDIIDAWCWSIMNELYKEENALA